MKTLLILLLLVSTRVYAVDSTTYRTNLPKRIIKVGDMNLTARQTTVSFGIVVDDNNTVYLMSVFGNGEVRSMRVSRVADVKQSVMERGWPYILDKRGRLYAFDVSWRSKFMAKSPIVMRTMVRHFRIAAGAAAVMFVGGYLNSAINFGLFHPNLESMTSWAATGFVSVYVLDYLFHALFRSQYQMHSGGNFFRKLIAKNVEEIEYNSLLDTHEIRYRGASHDPAAPRVFLRDVAPQYVRNTDCIFELINIANH